MEEMSYWGFVFIHKCEEKKESVHGSSNLASIKRSIKKTPSYFPGLVIRDEVGKFIAPIVISDFEKHYKTLGRSKISIVNVVLKDGTAPITLEEAFSVPEFENVFFNVKDVASVGIAKTNKKGVVKQYKIATVMKNNPQIFSEWAGQMIDDCISKEKNLKKSKQKTTA